jgi:hypothetical protein
MCLPRLKFDYAFIRAEVYGLCLHPGPDILGKLYISKLRGDHIYYMKTEIVYIDRKPEIKK